MSAADKAQAAVDCIHRGEYEAAAHFFAEAAGESPTSELMNDLGYAQLTCGRLQEAERSFRQALAIAPGNTQAAVNLGALLFNRGKIEAAAYWLERGIGSIDAARRSAVRRILDECQGQKVADTSIAGLMEISADIQ